MDLLAVMEDTLGLSQEARELVQRIVLLFEEMEKIKNKGILGYFVSKAVHREEIMMLRMLRTYFYALKENFGPDLMVEALEFIDAHRPGLILGKEFKEGIARFRERKYRASSQETSA